MDGRLGQAGPGQAWLGMARLGKAWQEWRGVAGHGSARRGGAWPGEAWQAHTHNQDAGGTRPQAMDRQDAGLPRTLNRQPR